MTTMMMTQKIGGTGIDMILTTIGLELQLTTTIDMILMPKMNLLDQPTMTGDLDFYYSILCH